MNARWFRLMLCACSLSLGTRSSCLAQAETIPLAVRDGHCEWVQPARNGPCFLVLGSLGSPTKQFRVSIQSEITASTPTLPRDHEHAARLAAGQVDQLRRIRQTSETYPPSSDPPSRKSFALFTGERDLENAANYTTVIAQLRGVGKHVQIYVDAQDSITADLDLAITEVTRTFDQEIHPWSREKLGQVTDVDRDGRFTILFSSKLQRLQGGKVALDGFVRGSDFLRDIGAPFGNRCDMMYLNSQLKTGPHLRTVLAHEYTHAVTFCEHVLNNPPGHRQDEESWLSEGLAHLVEDLHQHGWSNLDYRVSAYLAQPDRYPLVVADYFGSGLWRNPGTRGSVYLFLRWCHVQTGSDLPRQLIQSPLVGVANIEAAMQAPFGDLFRAWSVSLLQEDATPLPGRLSRPGDKAPARTPGSPNFLTLGQRKEEFALSGTALKFILLPATDRNHRVRVLADKDSRLQATLVEPHRSFLDVSCRATEPGMLVLEVTAHGGPVRLEAITWEKLEPREPGRDFGFRDLSTWQQIPVVQPGEKRRCTVVDFFPAGRASDLVVRAVGRDGAGRTVTGLTFLAAEK